MTLTSFSSEFLDQLVREAENSVRLRQHRNVHASYGDMCQRFFNAIGVDSYIRPHRHSLDPKAECLIAVRGRMTVVTFDDMGQVAKTIPFGVPGSGATALSVGVEVPPSVWHTIVANVPGSVLFEVKNGPFDPTMAKEWPVWAPEECTSQAAKYFHDLRCTVDLQR